MKEKHFQLIGLKSAEADMGYKYETFLYYCQPA